MSVELVPESVASVSQVKSGRAWIEKISKQLLSRAIIAVVVVVAVGARFSPDRLVRHRGHGRVGQLYRGKEFLKIPAVLRILMVVLISRSFVTFHF